MTQSRPTDAQIGVTLQQLHQIATCDTDAYLLLDHLISLYTWLLEEILASEQGRGFGHGANEVHVLGSVGSDLEGRLHDPLLREQRRIKRRWLAGLRESGHRWADDATNVAKMADDWRNQMA